MERPNVFTITRTSAGETRIAVDGFESDIGVSMSMGADFSQDTVLRMVERLCECAGLPEPWKKG